MKHFLLTSLLFLCTSLCCAQNVLNVYSKNGAVVTFSLSEKPVVTYSSNILVLTTQTTKVEYPLSDLEKVTFGDIESKVESISSSGISGDLTIRIYDLSGREIKAIGSDKDVSSPQLLLDDLNEGTFIVKQGNITYKIIK